MANSQAVVDAFNRDNQIGAHVQFWPGVREGRGKFSTTRTAAKLTTNGYPVVFVEDYPGYIRLTHVRAVPHQPDRIDEHASDLPVVSKAIPRIEAYVTEFGDGLYAVVNGAPLYGRDLAAVCRQLDKLSGWLIWSRHHNAWWKAEERGYTTDMLCAGRYLKDDAIRIASVRKMDDGSPGEVVVAAPEPEMFGLPNLMERMRARISAATRAANAARPAQEG